TVAGPYAAWMPRKSLHGRTCGVSCEGGRARTLQPDRRSHALLLLLLLLPLLLPRPHCLVPTRKQPAYKSWRGTTRQSLTGQAPDAYTTQRLALRQTGAFARLHEARCTA
ncbi:hypothetical protein XarjCFBP1022_19300, partial [Xanthomonas arboricola]